MRSRSSMVVLRSLLFVFDIENTRNEEREEIIVSKDVNDHDELVELFDILLRPQFLIYTSSERQKIIDMLEYYVSTGDDFDEVFTRIDTYFDDDVQDQHGFMKILLECLTRYQSDSK
ncbi:hypothetical protein SAMN04487857_12056 [Pseudomonas sp. ok272]|nr:MULTISPECIES: hypothetical protein [unclassified Pseudomonas]SEN52987.1 hypothetical protein SAMN04487857_12056 [Pseudomonas sp. ok272]SFN33516.1 hypothetical protein SAMN04487858_12056 [Pseudomonas sp. ok602]